MYGYNSTPKATATKVRVGDNSVSLKRHGQSEIALANILGRKVDDEGKETLWLDRLVHDDKEEFEGWSAWGAISTILARQQPAPPQTVAS